MVDTNKGIDEIDFGEQQSREIKNKYYYDLFLKTTLVCLLYYLIGMKSVSAYLKYYLPRGLDKLIIKTLLFGLFYFVISYLTNL